MKTPPMYEVWTGTGDGMRPGPRFRALVDALRYVEEESHDALVGIRNPDGSWRSPPLRRSCGPEADRGPPVDADDLDERPRILVVDDNRTAREALAELLRDEGYRVDTAADGNDALVRVVDDVPDLVISDVMMPHTDGFGLVTELRERAALSDLPIILISAVDDATRRVEGLDLGADDYLPKPLDFDELLARVRLHLRHAQRSREILARSTIDELTGVLNRGGILGVLERERQRARRDGSSLAVFVIDLDDFKSINDTFGHSAGDAVLRRVAENLVNAVRSTDMVGRFGGDEFLIVAPNTGPAVLELLTQRIKETQRDAMSLDRGVLLTPSLSVGSATDTGHASTEQLFNKADAAMYRQKRLRNGTH